MNEGFDLGFIPIGKIQDDKWVTLWKLVPLVSGKHVPKVVVEKAKFKDGNWVVPVTERPTKHTVRAEVSADYFTVLEDA